MYAKRPFNVYPRNDPRVMYGVLAYRHICMHYSIWCYILYIFPISISTCLWVYCADERTTAQQSISPQQIEYSKSLSACSSFTRIYIVVKHLFTYTICIHICNIYICIYFSSIQVTTSMSFYVPLHIMNMSTPVRNVHRAHRRRQSVIAYWHIVETDTDIWVILHNHTYVCCVCVSRAKKTLTKEASKICFRPHAFYSNG